MIPLAPVLPSGTLGVFGGGQLGRMFVMAAARLGYHTVVFAPEENCPAAQVAERHICASYQDTQALSDFARCCDAITVEFENVPVKCLRLASEHAIVRPGPSVLRIAQDRLLERRFLCEHGFPVAAHAGVATGPELSEALRTVGRPGVLKSSRLGYDGQGQKHMDAHADPVTVWNDLGFDRALYEAWVDYDLEISVLVARLPSGEIETFGPIENHHRNHILDASLAPARIDGDVAKEAVNLASSVAEALKLEGLICVEMFLEQTGRLLINELAPRPHNSGHLTVEACVQSQFEQQVRALCGIPLSKMTLRQPAAMRNLLGGFWSHGEPAWDKVYASDGVGLHLYGKNDPRPGRKMGHVTVLGSTVDEAEKSAADLLCSASTVPTPDRPD